MCLITFQNEYQPKEDYHAHKNTNTRFSFRKIMQFGITFPKDHIQIVDQL